VNRVARVGVIVTFAALVAGSAVGARSETAIEIGIRDRANASASIATSGSFVGIVWSAKTKDGVTDIYAATSRDSGRTFGTPVRVNAVAGEASASGEQPPRIALSDGASALPAIAVMWTAKSTNGTRLVSARSTDGGRSFSHAESVPGSDASGNRGWESMAMDPNADAVAVWLDHRNVPARTSSAGMPAGAHQHGATSHPADMDGAARAQLSQIFFARLADRGSARAIAPGVCYCCKTSVATAPDGRIVVAWRHVYPGNVRDIALTLSSDGGRTFAPPVRLSDDDWVLDGCPENGPSVAVDLTNTIHVVWPTLVQGDAGAEPSMKLFYATSRDGKSFTMRQPLPTNDAPRHPQLAVEPSGHIAVVWDEQAEGVRRIVAARGATDGTSVRFTRDVITDDRGTYPAIAPLADGALIAWTSGPVERSVLRITRRSPAQSR
jgi:hypothetical protein